MNLVFMRRSAPGVLLIAATVLPALAATGARPSAQHGDRYSLSGERVAISNLAGELRVEPGTGSVVVVEITPGGKDAGALRVETGRKGQMETLRVIYPGRRIVYPAMGRKSRSTINLIGDGSGANSWKGLFGMHSVTIAGSGSGIEAHADLRVLVPPGKSVEIYLAAGDAQITNVEGDLDLELGSGSLIARGTRGTFRLDSGSGDIHVSDVSGHVVLDTGSGPVVVSGVRGGSLTVDSGSGSVRISDVAVDRLSADTGSGSIDLIGIQTADLRLDTGSGAVRIDLADDVESVDIDTGSGGVTLVMPAKLGAEFDIETGSGGIHVDVPHQAFEIERDHVRGRIGDGRGSIRIESGSGGVRLLRRGGSGAVGARIGFGAGMFLAPAIE